MWLVSGLLVLAAVTGSAGPIQVIWFLGTISVAVGIAWSYLRGWFGGSRRDRRSEGEQSSEPLDTGPRSTGTDAGPGSGETRDPADAPSAGGGSSGAR
jgi:hypothetical protein